MLYFFLLRDAVSPVNSLIWVGGGNLSNFCTDLKKKKLSLPLWGLSLNPETTGEAPLNMALWQRNHFFTYNLAGKSNL